jgi:hypothetical protein
MASGRAIALMDVGMPPETHSFILWFKAARWVGGREVRSRSSDQNRAGQVPARGRRNGRPSGSSRGPRVGSSRPAPRSRLSLVRGAQGRRLAGIRAALSPPTWRREEYRPTSTSGQQFGRPPARMAAAPSPRRLLPRPRPAALRARGRFGASAGRRAGTA